MSCLTVSFSSYLLALVHVVASLAWVYQKCRRLMQPFLVRGSFWQMHAKQWCLGWYSSRQEEGNTCCGGKGHEAESLGAETSSPSSAGIGGALCTMSLWQQITCVWTWRAAFILALRYQCWTGLMIHQWIGVGNFRDAVAQNHFICRVFVEGVRLMLELNSRNATLRNLGAMKKFDLTRWRGNSKRHSEFSPQKPFF